MKHNGEGTGTELVDLVRQLQAARAGGAAELGGHAELRELSEWQKREFDRSSSPMRIFERATSRFLVVNDAAVKLYGYSREEFLRMTVQDTRHPAEHEDLPSAINEPVGYLRHRGPWRHVTKRGAVVVVEVVTQDILFNGVQARLSMSIDVTERHRALELLQQREQELGAVLRHTPDIVARIGRDFRHQYVNPAVMQATGRTPEDFLGKTMAEVGMPPDLVARWEAVLKAAFATGNEQKLECVLHGPNGPRHYESRIVPERHANGTVDTVLAITRDFTEHRNAEELLWLREQEFERLAENIPDLVARFDRDHRYVYVNAAVEKALGVSRHDMVGKTQRELGMPDELAAKFEKSLDEVIRTGNVHVIEFGMSTPQGERFLDAYHVPEGGMRHRVETVLCVARDITARKQVEAARGRLAAIVSCTSDAIISKDLDGTIQTWNPGAEQLFGYPAGEAVGRPITILIPPERLQEETLILERIRRGEHIEHFESVRCRKDGSRVDVSLTISPVKGPAEEVVGASSIARDITERKLAELSVHRSAALSRLLESLARAANEALSPEAAMAACLERICGYGRWVIGRVALYSPGAPKTAPLRSIWHTADPEKFAEVIRVSNNHTPNAAGGFLGRALREQAAVWIEDLERMPGFHRKPALLKGGLRSAFAFPVIVHGDVVAIMEVFSEKPRVQDSLTIGAAQSIASQLARIVERDWAHQANARMAAIVESSRDAIISRALDGTILTWNAGAERLLGYSAEEIIGRNIRLIMPEEFHDRMEERQARILQGELVPSHETIRIAKDGRRIHVSTQPAPIRDASGEVRSLSTIIRDITQRKFREQELRESEERFRLLAENIDQVFWINTLALDGNLYVSPAYEKIWGRSIESLRGDPNSWMASIHPEDLPRVREAVSGIASGNHLDVEYRILRPDGAVRWIRDRSYPMTRGDGTPLLCGLAEDITDLKRATAEQLEQAVRQRDALVREVHHRIKNSLQGVAGLLRQKTGKYPAAAPGIEDAISQLQSVALVYGLQGTRSDGFLSLAEVTEAICASAENLIGGRVERTFERRSLRSACIAGSEAVSVAVALNELVFNALKHQRAAAGKKRARVTLDETRGAAEIRISNRGRLPRGFDFAAGRAVGNGLGLVRTLLVAPGGSIAFNRKRSEVEVVLKLSPPLLAERGKAAAR